MRSMLAVFPAILLSQAAVAQTDTLMLGLCRKISDDPARLKCYDAIGRTSEPGASNPTEEKPRPEWVVREDKSPIDDSPQISALLRSDERNAMLVLRCKDRKTEAYVAPNGLLASQTGSVVIRLNDLPALTASWTASNDGQALFAPSGIDLIKSLPDDGRLFIRASGWQGRRASDATFLLGAVSAVREKIKAACQWHEATPKGSREAPKSKK